MSCNPKTTDLTTPDKHNRWEVRTRRFEHYGFETLPRFWCLSTTRPHLHMKPNVVFVECIIGYLEQCAGDDVSPGGNVLQPPQDC